jgi:hypothetical protein
VHDHRAVVGAQQRLGVGVGRARVDDDREPELRGESELRLEEAALLLLPLAAVVVVEPGLADGDDTGLGEQGAQLLETLGLPGARPVRVDAQGGEDAALGRGERERGPARRDPRADRDHPADAGVARPREGGAGLLERVEVRVGVDHG